MGRRDIADIDSGSRFAEQFSTIDRYDLLLGSIPAAFVLAALIGRLLGVPFEGTVLGGVAIATLAMLDGLFFRPPSGLQGA
ncbi:hypothetical protein [Natrinema sp. 1APR25-10V2]|uniref:hypothetical protein n=1 Tax=Natrinema sp. 1APR25-10V2 TaxID=2951081 RepID=UPI002873FBFB|nr:hypothetical protein [Natrinema sp. 1APR25-10V2]MDS0475210.1 hypothetical protein [Natrinema sp. 1APR25-10V2]